MTTIFARASLVVALISLIALPAFPVGYEKGVSLSGKHAGTSNAATSAVEGAEGLFFNPAGLGRMSGDNDFSVNLSGISLSAESPLVGEQRSSNEFATPFAIWYAQKMDDTITWGAGVSVQGGLKADIGEIQLNPALTAFSPKFATSLAVFEVTLGGSYNITDEFSVGIGYRISYATAEYSYGAAFASAGPSLTQVAIDLKSLTGLDFAGARLGAQYRTDDWGMGLLIRTPVKFTLEGEAEGKAENTLAPGSGTTVPLTKEDDLKVKSSLPTLISLGFNYDGVQDNRFHLQLDWYNYSVNEELEIEGTMTFGGSNVLSNITQKSKDSTAVRVGYEYLGFSMPIRAGFVYATQVSNKGYATPVSEPPGDGMGFSLGSSYELSESHMLHFGADYAQNNAKVEASDVPADSSTATGDYDGTSYSVHVGYQTSF